MNLKHIWSGVLPSGNWINEFIDLDSGENIVEAHAGGSPYGQLVRQTVYAPTSMTKRLREKTWYENGQLKTEVPPGWDIGEKTITTFNEDGSILDEITLKDGQRDGLYELCLADGTLDCRCFYDCGNLSGIYETFYKNGNRKERSRYINNRPVGLREYWYENGQLQRITFSNDKGQPCGHSISWNENGELSQVYCHELNGLSECWKPGEKVKISEYTDGRLNRRNYGGKSWN